MEIKVWFDRHYGESASSGKLDFRLQMRSREYKICQATCTPTKWAIERMIEKNPCHRNERPES